MNLTGDNVLKILKLLLIIVLITLLIIFMVRPIFNISFPFLFSLILAYLLSPIVNFLIKKGLKRTISILTTFLLMGLITTMISYSVIPVFYKSFAELMKSIPDIAERIRIVLNELTIRYQISQIPDGVKQSLDQNFEVATIFINSIFSTILNGLGSLISNIFFMILIPFITFYILNDPKYLKEKISMVIPIRLRTDAVLTWYQIDLVLKRFIRGELLIALIVGTATAVGMNAIGVKYSLVLGFIAGVTNLIPYLGPFIGVTPSILVALMISPELAVKAAVVFFVIQQAESGIIAPKIVGKSVGFHPITVIFVILLFEQLFGFIGMFFAVPVTSIAVVIYNRLIIMLNRKECQTYLTDSSSSTSEEEK